MEFTHIPEDFTKSTILIVDDELDSVDSLGIILRKENYQVAYANTGEHGLKMAKTIKPDLILLDIEMPGISGYQVCKTLKGHRKTRNIPIIFLTGRTKPDSVIKAFDAGGVDYITKPYNIKELLVRIHTHLELKFSRSIIEDYSKRISKTNRELTDMNNQLMEINSIKDNYLTILNSELQSAARYIISLLPIPIVTEKIKTSWKFSPSHQLGGDSFGYFFLENYFIFYLLDVSGHGVKSAFESVSVLNMLNYRVLPETDFTKPEQVLHSLNKAYDMADHGDLYFTIWYGVYNISKKILNYAGAGHPPAFLMNNKQIIRLPSKNKIIGTIKDFEFSSEKILINKNSSIYLYSDGVYDIKTAKGNPWNIDELSEYLNEQSNESNTEIESLFDYVKTMNNGEKPKDDFSILKVCLK